MQERLTLLELFALFGKKDDPWGKELGIADSLETLAIVTYLVARANQQ